MTMTQSLLSARDREHTPGASILISESTMSSESRFASRIACGDRLFGIMLQWIGLMP
jgi:hypothetical protein